MYTVAEHSRKDTDMNIAVSTEEEHSHKYTGQEHSHKYSGKYTEQEHSRKYTVQEITISIRCRNVLERKLLGNTGNNNLNINRR